MQILTVKDAPGFLKRARDILMRFGSLILVPLLISCVGGAPQLSFQREPGETPAPPIAPITGNNTFGASGGIFYASERFAGFGSSAFIDGGGASSPSYRMVSPELSASQRILLPPSDSETQPEKEIP